MSWKRGDHFVLRGKDGKIEQYGVAIGNVLAVVFPNWDFYSPECFDQISIPENAEKISEENLFDVPRCYCAIALVATRRMM